MPTVSIAALHVYPIKSCRGHDVTHAALDARGLAGDRRFLVVDSHGKFITQRETPRLAWIVPTVTAGQLTLAAKGVDAVTVSTTPNPTVTREVVVWRDTVRAVDLGNEVAEWLSAFLGRSARLVGTGAEFARPMRSAAARPGDEVAFADAHPLLIIGEASLEDLNHRLDSPLPMNRFRPNLIVRGAPAFAEDAWKRIRIGDVVLRASGPCARCAITTTDQETLERAKEPLRTLALYRRSANGDVNFGQNYVHETKSGTLRVGDAVEILE